jgi:phosphate-selective porin OprO/OprP
MNRFLHLATGLTVLLIIISVPGTLRAQDNPQTELEEATKKIESKQKEATTDLRESVHENLDTIQEDAQSSSDLKMAQDALETAREQQADNTAEVQTPTPDAEPGTEAEQAPAVTEKKSIIDYLQAVPGFLQSVPDRVPFIRERGLIFFGRTELDYAYYSSGITSSDSGFRVRSLRAGLAKAFPHSISMKAEVDLTDGDSNFADLYVRYRHKRWGLFTAGNQRVAQTLVNQTSRISRTFMEEPLPAEAFGLGRRLALGWDVNKSKAGIHFTLFGPDLNGSIGDSGFAGRVYFNPTRDRFSLGIYDDVTHQYIGAAEIAGAKDSFMFRGEFFRATWQRSTAKDPVFVGGYIQASWVLTGESFNYTQGKFIRIRPQSLKGAWEVAVRYSMVDLNDRDVTGGKERNFTVGLNWYAPANQFRVMSNLIFVRTDEYAGNESPTIIQLKAQFHW